ncbi:Xaa-Pro peptidase family protein [Bacillus sp. 165]|uniref:M24 family metallopeptidase n=1 Tax=Bacillus sp. 165 TaxID=1529117 RepID=UPI001AD97C22|nr:Xaa-Pro peptidase family protein [Bacillus sp. 165]MBO9130629.1 aminopeptidase P family protein [Bacillus sp. 165]
MHQRLEKLTHWLKENDIQAAFLSSTPSVFYMSQFHCEPHERLLGLFVFQEAEPLLVCPKMEEAAAKKTWKYDILGYTDTDNTWDMIGKALQARGIKGHSIAIEKEHLNVERYEYLRSLFPEASFISAESQINELRLVKDEQELTILRQAASMADFAIEIGVNEIAEGKTELEILATIENEIKKKGINKMSFDTMVLTGANSALPHGVPGLNRIESGDFVLFDLGVVIDGYCSDITRTVAFRSVNEEQQRIYDTVLAGQLKAIEACKPGVAIAEIDKAARSTIADAGYGQYFPHRLGHGLGISVHEYPSITDVNETPLKEGMVFTIEPGIYVPNVGGVRIEDDIYVTKDGVEILTKFPKELQLIK